MDDGGMGLITINPVAAPRDLLKDAVLVRWDTTVLVRSDNHEISCPMGHQYTYIYPKPSSYILVLKPCHVAGALGVIYSYR